MRYDNRTSLCTALPTFAIRAKHPKRTNNTENGDCDVRSLVTRENCVACEMEREFASFRGNFTPVARKCSLPSASCTWMAVDTCNIATLNARIANKLSCKALITYRSRRKATWLSMYVRALDEWHRVATLRQSYCFDGRWTTSELDANARAMLANISRPHAINHDRVLTSINTSKWSIRHDLTLPPLVRARHTRSRMD